jgi:hypothetical protein
MAFAVPAGRGWLWSRIKGRAPCIVPLTGCEGHFSDVSFCGHRSGFLWGALRTHPQKTRLRHRRFVNPGAETNQPCAPLPGIANSLRLSGQQKKPDPEARLFFVCCAG